MQIWRICRQAFASAAFTGEGARLFGGRWNSPGVSIVYASTSLALAAVETFVHLEPNLLPDDLVSIEAELPEEVSTGRLSLASLPRDWHGRRNDQALRRFGDEWARVGKTVGLFVPSAAIRGEWNLLVNPAHRDFPRLAMGRPKRFEFDLRMFR